MPSVKPSTTVGEQVDLLRARGMDLSGADVEQWLTSVGYYRLSGYMHPYRAEAADQFLPGTRFSHIAMLYEADRKLRTLVHDGVERVEVGLRAAVCRVVVDQHGPLGHEMPGAFRPTFNHAEWRQAAQRRVNRSRSRSAFIRHHEERYAGRLPLWALMEVLDFSDVSKLVDGMLVRDQWSVAEAIGLKIPMSGLSRRQQEKVKKSHPLARWCEQLTIVRNTAAHHSRLWNVSFVPATTVALRGITGLDALPEGQSERVGGALLVIGHLLRTLSPGSSWSARVSGIVYGGFGAVRENAALEMGLHAGWDSPGSSLAPGA